jgi:hypothetical protein
MDNEWAGGFVKSDGSDVCKERCVERWQQNRGAGSQPFVDDACAG